MGDWWDWDSASPRSVQRLWRFLDPGTAAIFQTPGEDGRPTARRIEDVLEAIRGAGITYRYGLPYRSDANSVLSIRPPALVWRQREATCLDISLVAASTLQHAGLRTWVVVATGASAHSWVVVDTAPDRPFSLPNANAEPLGDIAEWEESNRPPMLDEDAISMLERGRSVERWQPIDVSVLLRGYPHGDDRMAGSVTEAMECGLALHQKGWRTFEVCDASWWSRRMLVPPPDPPTSAPRSADRRERRRGRRVARWIVAPALAAAVVAGGLYLNRAGGDPNLDAATSPALKATDLRPTWIDSGRGSTALKLDPVLGLVDQVSYEGDWIGPTHDGTEVWTHDAEGGKLLRYSSQDGEELGEVALEPLSERIDVLAGSVTGEDGVRLVWSGSGGVRVDWLDLDGTRRSTATWPNAAAGGVAVVAGRAGADDATIVVRPSAQSSTELPDPVLVQLGSDGTADSAQVPACDSAEVSVLTTPAGTSLVCGSTMVHFDRKLVESYRLDLPERSDAYETWEFVDTAMLAEGEELDPKGVLLWHVTGGLLEVDLVRREITSRSSDSEVHGEDDLRRRHIQDVWYAPPSTGSTVVAMVRRGPQRLDGGSDMRIERIGSDLVSAVSTTSLPAAGDAAVEWHDGRPVIVTSATGSSALDVTTAFVDPSTGTLLGSSNPAHDLVLAPAPGGAWVMGFADRNLRWVEHGSQRKTARSVWLESSGDLGPDGLPPQRGAVEHASDDRVLVSYWDDGAWHLDVIDSEGRRRELTEAPGGLEVQAADPDGATVWVRETFGDGGLWGDPVHRLRHVDVETGEAIAAFDVDLAATTQQWVVAPGGGVIVYSANRLTHLDERGRPDAVVDLGTETVAPEGAGPVALTPEDEFSSPAVHLARFGDSVAMLWKRDLLSASVLFVVLDPGMRPTGPARLLAESNSALADSLLWPLTSGIAVGTQFAPLGVFDGTSLHPKVESLADFRLYQGAVLALGDDEPWSWIDGPADPPQGPAIDVDCGTSIDQMVRVADERLVLCPSDRSLVVVRPGSSEQHHVGL